jgi:hypothetical protein
MLPCEGSLGLRRNFVEDQRCIRGAGESVVSVYVLDFLV